MIAIIGAGLAGLSTAYHLKKDYAIYERENEVGGLCKSYTIDGFTFDYTGHLLHFRNKEIKGLILRLLQGRLNEIRRKAYIFSKGVYTEYPFQSNTFGLPKEVVKECLMGFIEAYLKKGQGSRVKGQENKETFEDWIYKTFGKGIAKHFMLPFNEKFWKTPLNKITRDWVSWLVPMPRIEDVVSGAIGIGNKDIGYNPVFHYPLDGGIDILPKAFLSHIKNLNLGIKAISISLKNKRIVLSNGREAEYDFLISTMPLPELIKTCDDAPLKIKSLAKGLKYMSVYDINLGIRRENISDKHWIYFPEKDYPFYRVGFPMNFSKFVVPEGCSSMYVEISHRGGREIQKERLINDAVNGLIKAGILRKDDEIAVKDIVDIRYAYTIYDFHRQKAVPAIQKYLAEKGVFSIGRYGAWEHTSMEDAIYQGRMTAQRLNKRNR
ncbi:MAG: FAD-dependent oxidoreductase [Nitrospirae bacterium]|nr:FAD-dependent oxidoreductase [Nitrospirota bacterium]